jgi:hypothetical protein
MTWTRRIGRCGGQAETTKNWLEQVVPYSEATGVLLLRYLAHRAIISWEEKIGRIDADDSLYAELRRCRDHCTGAKRRIEALGER